jgi:hypothetical protein
MSSCISPVRLATTAVSTFAPTKAPKNPLVLDESNPCTKFPIKKITVSIMDKIVENIKKKPESERKLLDYVILVADQLMKLNPKIYAS